MGACDCIITKVGSWTDGGVDGFFFFYCFYLGMFASCLQAGPGTIAEALIRGLPIILNDFIPGQVCADATILNSLE